MPVCLFSFALHFKWQLRSQTGLSVGVKHLQLVEGHECRRLATAEKQSAWERRKGDPSLKTQCAIALIHAFVWPVSFMLRRRNIVLLFIKRPTAFDLFYAMIHHLSVCLSIITSLYTVHTYAYTSVCPPRSEYIIYTHSKCSNKKRIKIFV